MDRKKLEIRFIRNFTVESIGEAARQQASAAGIDLEADYGAYDSVMPELLALQQAAPAPDAVVVLLDADYFAGGLYSPAWSLEEAEAELGQILAAVEKLPPQTFVLLATFLPPFRSPLPWAPAHPVLGRGAAAFALNDRIREFVGRHPGRAGLLDCERLAARLGESASLDPRFGLMMKAPFRQALADAAGAEIVRQLASRLREPKKVLVLDCDNTLWGGVVGEAGLEGIELDPYEYPGIAYYRFQFEVLSLIEQGVLVCLCSKNDPEAVSEVLERHPHCLLRKEHLAGSRVNWTDKATNIRDLASELNLATESMVFVDDSAAECELVRSSLPEVTVIQVPSRIYQFPGTLLASGHFDRAVVNPDDAKRTRYYQAEEGRRRSQSGHVDLESFLRSLEMQIEVRPVDDASISRVAQLCQRTNQFNLTTLRYSESDLQRMRDEPDTRIFLLDAADRFGSVGICGVIIWRRRDSGMEVDTFLLSCRVIGRRLDHALFYESLRRVRELWGDDRVLARYIPTAKNRIVKDLWAEYGLAALGAESDGLYRGRTKDLTVSFPSMIRLARNP